jgi:hypothetical protein
MIPCWCADRRLFLIEGVPSKRNTACPDRYRWIISTRIW